LYYSGNSRQPRCHYDVENGLPEGQGFLPYLQTMTGKLYRTGFAATGQVKKGGGAFQFGGRVGFGLTNLFGSMAALSPNMIEMRLRKIGKPIFPQGQSEISGERSYAA
jgi:hypothetical protein